MVLSRRTVLGLLGVLCFASTAHARDPQVRVGLSAVCPSQFTGGTAQGESVFLAAGVAIATSAAANIAGHLVDKAATYLTAEDAIKATDVMPVSALLTSSTGSGDKKVFIASPAKCVWVAVADEFSEPGIDGGGASIKGSTWAEPTSDQARAIVPFPIASNAPAMMLGMVGAKSPLRFYFEGKWVSHDKEPLWRLAPQLAWYPRFIAQNNIFKSQHDLAMTLTFTEPGKDTAIASFPLVQNAIEEGDLTTERVRSIRYPWVPIPKPATIPADGGAFYPVNLTVNFIETRKPNAFANALGKALADNKSSVTGAVSSETNKALGGGSSSAGNK